MFRFPKGHDRKGVDCQLEWDRAALRQRGSLGISITLNSSQFTRRSEENATLQRQDPFSTRSSASHSLFSPQPQPQQPPTPSFARTSNPLSFTPQSIVSRPYLESLFHCCCFSSSPSSICIESSCLSRFSVNVQDHLLHSLVIPLSRQFRTPPVS